MERKEREVGEREREGEKKKIVISILYNKYTIKQNRQHPLIT